MPPPPLPAPPPPPSPAPRSLAPLFTVRVLFSGWVGQFGWLFCAFGMLFVAVFDPASSIKEWFAFRGEIHTAEGVATGYDQTNMTINDVRVFETGYRFSMPDGREITDVSFSNGSWMEPGDFVIVEYVDGDVPLSRIAGMRRSSSGSMALIVVIFPVIGLLIGLSSVLYRLRHLRDLHRQHHLPNQPRTHHHPPPPPPSPTATTTTTTIAAATAATATTATTATATAASSMWRTCTSQHRPQHRYGGPLPHGPRL